ncbi:hypothetical protein AYI69_g4445 [Smittium culicis]|uniref:Uncharacterized protein n=1 Tax=Smittium culicis TaxID=133412 RepID=A0A1R1YDK1_9FUNG|nr:hypothetical protein AYI69_g4445 [Smittium culicis]
MKYISLTVFVSIAAADYIINDQVLQQVSSQYPVFESSMNQFISDLKTANPSAYAELTSEYGRDVVPTTFAASDITEFFDAVPTQYNFLSGIQANTASPTTSGNTSPTTTAPITLATGLIATVSSNYTLFESSMNQFIADLKTKDSKAFNALTSSYGSTVVPTTFAASDISKFFQAVPTPYNFLSGVKTPTTASIGSEVIAAVSSDYSKYESSMNKFIEDIKTRDSSAYNALTSKYGGSAVPTTYAASDISKFFQAVPTQYNFLSGLPPQESSASVSRFTILSVTGLTVIGLVAALF